MTINKLVWKDEYSVNIEEIDNQHKQIIAILNDVIEAISSNLTKESLKLILDSLVVYKKQHFATEEKYFAEFGYEGAEHHMAEHREFDGKIKSLLEKDSDDAFALAFELANFMEDWLIEHMMTEDKKYMKCFSEHGLK